jgi:hypothetical protein
MMMIFVVLFIYIRHLTIKVLPEKKKEAVKLQFAGYTNLIRSNSSPPLGAVPTLRGRCFSKRNFYP